MVTSKQTVSVVLFFLLLSAVSILCFFDVSSMVYLLSEMYQLINRRNMIVLCHFILLFIVKDSGLLSHRRNESSVYKEDRGVAIEKAREFDVRGVRLERKEEIGANRIRGSLDMVVIMEKQEEVVETDKAEDVVETDKAEELEEEAMEAIESNGEEKWDKWSDRGVGHGAEDEAWEDIDITRSGAEEEEESGALVEYAGDGGEEEQEMEIEELNRKFEDFIKKFKQQMSEQTVLA